MRTTGIVYRRTMREQRRGLFGWSIGVAALAAMFVLIYPMVRDMPDLELFLDQYPEAFGRLFNIEAMTTGPGFLNGELFSFIGPALFLVYGIGRGARGIAGEEETGTLEILLSTPASRTSVLAGKALALLTGLAVLAGVLLATMIVLGPLVDLGLGIGQAAAGSLAMALLGAEFGLLALAVGAVTGHRGVAVGVAGVAAVASYALYILGALVEGMAPWQFLSPVQHAVGSEPVIRGLSGGYTAAMAVVALALLLLASPLFERRDVAA